MNMSGKLDAPAASHLGKACRYPLDNKVGEGGQSRSGRCGVKNNFLPLPGFESEFFNRPAHNLVPIQTELPGRDIIHVYKISNEHNK
jgi:hypothetical protein